LLGGKNRHAACRKKIIHNYRGVTVELPNGNGNGRELVDGKMGMAFKFQMGMGWE